MTQIIDKMRIENKIQSKIDNLIETDFLAQFRTFSIAEKADLIQVLIRTYRKFKESKYIDCVERLLDDLFDIKEVKQQARLLPSDKTQVISASFAYALLQTYDLTRIKRYLELAQVEFNYLTSEDRSRIKEKGQISYDRKGKSIRVENSYYIYPFWIKMAVFQDDELLLSRGLNEFFAIHHQLWDNDAKLYHSEYRKRLFKYRIDSKNKFSSESNTIMLTAITELAEILNNMVGMRQFRTQLVYLKKMAMKLIITLISYIETSESVILPSKIVPNEDYHGRSSKNDDHDIPSSLRLAENSIKIIDLVADDEKFTEDINRIKIYLTNFIENQDLIDSRTKFDRKATADREIRSYLAYLIELSKIAK